MVYNTSSLLEGTEKQGDGERDRERESESE